MDQDAEAAYVYLKLGIRNRWSVLLMEIDTL